MAKLYNLARMTTATTGTGTITLGSAASGFITFAAAGVADGQTVTYAIEDGSNREIGRGVYTSSGTTLSRSVLRSTNSDAAINLSGTAEVFISAAAEDFNALPNTTGAASVKLAAGTNVSADRTLTITTGDNDRTLDISAANTTISSFAATLLDDTTAAAFRSTLATRLNYLGSATISDDNANSWSIPQGAVAYPIMIGSNTTTGVGGIVMVRTFVSSQNVAEIVIGGYATRNYYSTSLADTTGADNSLNFGADTSGNFYIENRTGSVRAFYLWQFEV